MLKFLGGMDDKKWSYYFMFVLFQDFFTSPIQFETAFSSHRHTHGHTYNPNAYHNLHAPPTPFISKPANPSLLHFHDGKLSPPCCQNSRGTPRTKCSHPASDLVPLATLVLTRWHPSLLSSGRHSVQVKFSCTYTCWAPLSLYTAHKTMIEERSLDLRHVWAVFS